MSQNDNEIKRILCIDGGGIKGVFPAAFLSWIDDQLEQPINEYFDLIVGTSTGGIIALGLGLGIPMKEILELYEKSGPEIFGQENNAAVNFVTDKLKFMRQLGYGSKHKSDALEQAVQDKLQDKLIGESSNRLVIPSFDPITGRVYIYKTAHHPRFESDYKKKASEVALATSAAPTFLKPQRNEDGIDLVDGGVWANNPIGIAAVEVAGVLKWDIQKVKILSIGTLSEQPIPRHKSGAIRMMKENYLVHMFMAGQSHSAMGTAKLLTGDGHDRQAIWRINQDTPTGRYGLDKTKFIQEMKGRAATEAREQIALLRPHFFQCAAEPFTPYHRLSA